MRLKDPQFLLLLLFMIPMIWIYLLRERSSPPAIRFSDLSGIKKLPSSMLLKWRHIVFALRMAGLCLLVVALARPQQGRSDSEVTTEGIDIMLILDVSQSMEALDFKPDNRLAVVAAQFSYPLG